MTRERKPSRVERIIDAERTVRHWLNLLTPLSPDDPRFDGALVGYEAAIAFRRMMEKDR